MCSDAELPRELQHYVQQARKMRREYLAALWHQGFVALFRVIRWARDALANWLKSGAQMFERRRHRATL